MKTWLFWDWWHIEHQDNVQLCQGQPKWIPDATYEDPNFDYLGFWPRVYRDEKSGQWRMLYLTSGFPLTLMGAESDDGIHWRPMNRPDIQPPGQKYAPNHLFTVESANGGPVYIDLLAKDGHPFKFYCVQRGGPVAERARLDEVGYIDILQKLLYQVNKNLTRLVDRTSNARSSQGKADDVQQNEIQQRVS